MEDEIDVTRRIIDQIHYSDIPGGQMESESGVTRSIIVELDSSDIRRDQTEGESALTRSIIHELPLWISKEINWNVKVVLIKISLLNFILQYLTRSNVR